MEFDYFYNRDGDRFSYYMLPKIIVIDERFKNSSSKKSFEVTLKNIVNDMYTKSQLEDFKKTVADYLAWEVSNLLRNTDKENERLKK